LFGVLSVTFFVPHLVLAMTTSILLPGWAVLLHLIVAAGVYFVAYWHFVGQTLPHANMAIDDCFSGWRQTIDSQANSPLPSRLAQHRLPWGRAVMGAV
jgi:hypothetical protein